MSTKKKILIISSSINHGGMGQYILNLLSILSDKYECFVLTTHQKGDLYSSLSNYKCSSQCLEKHKRIYRYYHLWKTIKTISPDIIINNYNACVQYILPILPKRIKTIHILHSDDKRFYRIANINAKFISAWVAPSPKVLSSFNNYTQKKLKDKIHLIPHGVNENKDIAISQNKKQISLIFIGVIDQHKGVEFIPDIIKKITEKGIPYHFTFVGDGLLRQKLCSQLSTEIKQGFVTFYGNIPQKEVYEKLKESDCLIFPTKIESFGLVIAEAMINAVVPITTKLSGITDYIIENQVSGILVENYFDTDVFASEICKLANAPSLLASLKKNCLQRARNNFSIEIMEKNYISLINKIIS